MAENVSLFDETPLEEPIPIVLVREIFLVLDPVFQILYLTLQPMLVDFTGRFEHVGDGVDLSGLYPFDNLGKLAHIGRVKNCVTCLCLVNLEARFTHVLT